MFFSVLRDAKSRPNNRINAELEVMCQNPIRLLVCTVSTSPTPTEILQNLAENGLQPNPQAGNTGGWKAKPLSEVTPVSNQSVNPADYQIRSFATTASLYMTLKTYGL